VLSSETIHRFYTWHILHKLAAKWGNVGDRDSKTECIKDIVYNSRTVVEFQTIWDNLMDKLGYRENFWFKSIYNMRERWVLAHMNDKFWAGMTTTQCVESLNTFLKKYLRQKATLGEFVIRFQEALKRIWEGEHEAEHDYKYKILRLNSALNIKR
jgi:hypothetical protein